MIDTFSVWNPLTLWSKVDGQKKCAHDDRLLHGLPHCPRDQEQGPRIFDGSECFVFVFNPGKIQRVCKNSQTYAQLNICLPFYVVWWFIFVSLLNFFNQFFLKIRGFSFVSREDQITLITTCMWVQKVWIFPGSSISESTWHLSPRIQLLWPWIYSLTF